MRELERHAQVTMKERLNNLLNLPKHQFDAVIKDELDHYPVRGVPSPKAQLRRKSSSQMSGTTHLYNAGSRRTSRPPPPIMESSQEIEKKNAFIREMKYGIQPVKKKRQSLAPAKTKRPQSAIMLRSA